MSLGEIQQVSEGIYAYLQPDGSWYLKNTGFLVSRDGVISVDATSGTTPTATTCSAARPSSATNGAGRRSSARLMGSITGWIEVLEGVLRPLGAQTLVPGHGPVCGPEVIDDVVAYLHFVQHTAREAKAAGLSPLEAARAVDLGEFKDLLDAERIVGNLHRAYLELDGAERGAPVDLARALGDMVVYNGGRPLTCHA
jgi:hypothetical protein